MVYKYALEKVKHLSVDLSIALLDHRLQGSEFDSAIISFIAVVGLDSKKKTFKEVEACTQDLSALLKIAQLVVLRQSIYVVEENKADYFVEPLEAMKARFMIYNSRSPIGWLLSIWTYGFKLIQNMTKDGSVVWSNNYQTISIDKFEVTLEDF